MNTEGQPNQAPENAAAKPPEKRKTINFPRLALSAPCPGVPGVKSSLYWAVFDGNPRIVVKTNDPADQTNYGKITAAMGAWDVGALVRLIGIAVTSTVAWKMGLDKKNMYKGSQTFDTPQHINDVIVGRDADGVVYLSVKEEGRPYIKFPLVFDEFSQLMHSDGTFLTPGESSAIFAPGYGDIVLGTISSAIAAAAVDRSNNPEPFEPRQQGGGFQKKQWQPNGGGQGGGGGGYQQRQGGGGQGGYQKKSWQGGQGGGGYQNNRQGGGGGNWQPRQGGNQGGGYNNQNQSRPPAADKPVDMPDVDIPF